MYSPLYPPDRVGHSHDLAHLLHIVHPNNICPASNTRRHRSCRPPLSLPRDALPCYSADKPLSTRPQQPREPSKPPIVAQFRESSNALKILRLVLCKPEAWV